MFQRPPFLLRFAWRYRTRVQSGDAMALARYTPPDIGQGSAVTADSTSPGS